MRRERLRITWYIRVTRDKKGGRYSPGKNLVTLRPSLLKQRCSVRFSRPQSPTPPFPAAKRSETPRAPINDDHIERCGGKPKSRPRSANRADGGEKARESLHAPSCAKLLQTRFAYEIGTIGVHGIMSEKIGWRLDQVRASLFVVRI